MYQRTISTIGFSLFQSSAIAKIEIQTCHCKIPFSTIFIHLFFHFQIYPTDSLHQVKTSKEVFEWIINRAHTTELLLNENC
jgi:hypothetical protein